MSLSGVVRGELESVKDGNELVVRFRRFLDPDSGFATREEVAALSEYLARVDALVHALEQAVGDPVHVVRFPSVENGLYVFSGADLATLWIRQALERLGELSREKDEDGRVRFLASRPGLSRESCVATLEAVVVDERIG